MTKDRPQTLINTGAFVFGFAVKSLFWGQMSLKLPLFESGKNDFPEGAHKRATARPLPGNRMARDSVGMCSIWSNRSKVP